MLSSLTEVREKQVAFCILLDQSVDPNLLQVHRMGNGNAVILIRVAKSTPWNNGPFVLENPAKAFSFPFWFVEAPTPWTIATFSFPFIAVCGAPLLVGRLEDFHDRSSQLEEPVFVPEGDLRATGAEQEEWGDDSRTYEQAKIHRHFTIVTVDEWWRPQK
jgi:hypothetical protein